MKRKRKKKRKFSSLYEKEMSKPSFKKAFEDSYPRFKIEVQLLNELEKHGLSYIEFAQAIGTQKSNISRDLKGGGIHHVTLNRLKKMASALNCIFIPLIIPKEKEDEILPRIEKIVTHI